MPPWPPDNQYSEFKHNRSLSPYEQELLLRWLRSSDKPEGKSLSIVSPEAIRPLKKEAPDYAVIQNDIRFKESLKDTIWTFEIPYELTSSMDVGQIVFDCSNIPLIHHCNYFILPDGASTNDPGRFSFALGYSPGNQQLPFPTGTGFTLPKKGKIKGELHIPSILQPTSINIAFQFYRMKSLFIYSLNLLPIQNLKPNGLNSLKIPPDSVVTFTGTYTLERNEILTHINPHMHLLGKSTECFAITPESDTIPLIRINDWNFNWQDFYEFEKPIALKAGTIIVLKMTYDNTAENILNPNIPPKEVIEGWFTGQEMFTLLILSKSLRSN
jgi:hypothetical protein